MFLSTTSDLHWVQHSNNDNNDVDIQRPEDRKFFRRVIDSPSSSRAAAKANVTDYRVLFLRDEFVIILKRKKTAAKRKN